MGLIDGEVNSLELFGEGFKRVPNVGWRTIEQNKDKIGLNELLFDGIRSDDEFYFVHSFGVSSNNKHVIASSVYEDIKFAAAVSDGNVFGLQFHPEKSHRFGMELLKNFGVWAA